MRVLSLGGRLRPRVNRERREGRPAGGMPRDAAAPDPRQGARVYPVAGASIPDSGDRRTGAARC
jgi:hypothetical protein